MNKILNLDSPVMQFLSKMADLIWLNILTMICCIPIVTAGAAFTALHYSVLKMVRNEDGYLTRLYFKSFKQNFRQATIIWLLLLLFAGIMAIDIYIMNNAGVDLPKAVDVLILAIGLFVLMVSMYVFPVLARFENTIINTIKNAISFSIIMLPQTIVMAVVYCIPIIVALFFLRILPLVVLFGFSVPAYVSALLYSKTFKKFEPEETDGENMTEEESTAEQEGTAEQEIVTEE